MQGEGLEPGDKVKIRVPEENRTWGYSPAPNGTECVVLGFNTIYYGRIRNYGREPGLYENRCWVNVRLPDGKELNISSCHIEPVDDGRYKALLDSRRGERGLLHYDRRLGPLPSARFWELDRVRFGSGEIGTVTGIDYAHLTAVCNDGFTPYPAYSVSREEGSYCSYRESELTLVERGPVWKYEHGEELVWNSLEAELRFFHSQMGHSTQVLNPASDNYTWEKDQILAAVQAGDVDLIVVSGNPLVRMMGGEDRKHTLGYKLHDPDLGRRCREQTLIGFGMVPGLATALQRG